MIGTRSPLGWSGDTSPRLPKATKAKSALLISSDACSLRHRTWATAKSARHCSRVRGYNYWRADLRSVEQLLAVLKNCRGGTPMIGPGHRCRMGDGGVAERSICARASTFGAGDAAHAQVFGYAGTPSPSPGARRGLRAGWSWPAVRCVAVRTARRPIRFRANRRLRPRRPTMRSRPLPQRKLVTGIRAGHRPACISDHRHHCAQSSKLPTNTCSAARPPVGDLLSVRALRSSRARPAAQLSRSRRGEPNFASP